MSPGSDDAARLVHADSLVAKADPQGEYIILECELARGGYDRARGIALRTRAQELLQRHRDTWLASASPSNGLGRSPVLRRGCVEELTIPADVFVTRQAELADRFPWLSHVHLTGLDVRTSAYGDRLWESDWHPVRDRIERALPFTTSFEPVDAMVTWEKRAGFDYEEHTDAVMLEIVEWLIATNRIAKLTGLELEYATPEVFARIVAEPAAASLLDLRLHGEIFDEVGVQALAETTLRPERLSLHDRSATLDVVLADRALQSPLLENVRELAIMLPELGIVDGPALDRVEVLTIVDSTNPWAPRDLALEPLFEARHLRSLRVLRLESRFPRLEDARMILASPLGRRLEALHFLSPPMNEAIRRLGWDGVVLSG